MDDLMRDFLTETAESMGQVDNDLVALEQSPSDGELIGRIFRLVHTVKGTCGFLGLSRLEKVAHAAENVLGRYRDGTLEATQSSIGLVLNAMDRLKTIVVGIERAEGAEPAGDDSELIAQLDALFAGDGATAGTAETLDEHFEPTQALASADATPPADVAPPAETISLPAPPPAASAPAAGSESPPGQGSVASQSIRVAVDLLEGLMTTVSELVLTRNQLMQALRTQETPGVQVPLQRLSQITSELQEGIMRTRMQPIGNAWSKLPRLVRDLSVELSKKIDLDMRGAETELDRQVLELIRDPLTHMVRNSADHGLETTAQRIEAGKPETGMIVLNAYHKGGHIIIEIRDDGRGLPIDKIRAKAIANGLVSEAAASQMSPQQIQSFIFKAGFSTAEKVTSVSGRGVGMDVVRTNIERIGGSIDLQSTEGNGTAFFIKIPLTLAIVSALIVEAAGQRFAIPQIAVSELVLTRPEQIEHIGSAPVFRLRDRLLPLVNLSTVLGLAAPMESHGGLIVVAQVGTQTFGIVVDRVYDIEEIVVKPVAPILRHLAVYSGNTILGDGSVIMILDPNGLASMVGHLAADDGSRKKASTDLVRSNIVQLLVFEAAAGANPMAVPLERVARLEEIDADKIESVDGRFVLQYRGELMTLIAVNAEAGLPKSRKLPVLVFGHGGKTMGLAVERILDIVETELELKLGSRRQATRGTAIVAGKATEILDVDHYLRLALAGERPEPVRQLLAAE